jgi:hypothetical protein
VAPVAAVAGRRPDPDAEDNRFPRDEVLRVECDLRDILSHYEVQTIISSAAAGADLLALRAARDVGVRKRIVVLPFSLDEFRGLSVMDRGEEWTSLFDKIVADIKVNGKLVVLHGSGDRDAAYREVNHEILRRARSAAKRAGPGAPLAIAAWDGKRRASGDFTAEFLEEANREGFKCVEVITSRRPRHK